MSLKGKIKPSRGIQGKTKPAGSIQAKSMSYTPTQKLGDLLDVDTTNRKDGSIIVWDEVTQSFKVIGEIENDGLNIIGGSF